MFPVSLLNALIFSILSFSLPLPQTYMTIIKVFSFHAYYLLFCIPYTRFSSSNHDGNRARRRINGNVVIKHSNLSHLIRIHNKRRHLC
jgi:hypothetical protein